MKILIFVLFLTACATTSLSYYTPPVEVRDDMQNGRLEVSILNKHEFPICFSEDNWPNKWGKIDAPKDSVILQIGDTKYRLREMNMGYCYGGCELQIESQKRVTSYFYYRDFSIPEPLYHSPKTLSFSPTATNCR